jgi:ribonuclease HI
MYGGNRNLPLFYIDGQSLGNHQRGQPRAARIVVLYKEKPTGSFTVDSEDIGDMTNNEAEYYALLKALSIIEMKNAPPVVPGQQVAPPPPTTKTRAKKKGVPIEIFSDSQLIVKQVKGEYQVTDRRLQDLRDKATKIIDRIGPVSLKWVPREENPAGKWMEKNIDVPPNIKKPEPPPTTTTTTTTAATTS